ncbi:3-deoxy-7-phosphoheptulonate synthase [Planomonospora parontospora]|uniref:3-deoxy-7-phosphoheptulonate synthase n=1 Tax=Planomonospora parontospora TaxID=58119 RepID=UPI00199861ED|nr:3-deoxy-7-phosphoheptulonate synthase [Planomonospora parontospora]GGL51443.1 phospho-2-dehydro-3-deoxyheptonate aldolase [Planomonospora parontospora subsp. antibiotica]GII19106.1 phospho-2-dehydro-3-deoxyheptonate aldolase [Planomonospora parontospora subsp. antibiotica]
MTAATAQQPDWGDPALLERVTRTLHTMPPLVTAGECDRLIEAVARVGRGEGFLLQGGDCAERFCESGPAEVRAKLAQLYGLAAAIRSATGSLAVPLGRLAGQYGKPRSAPYERMPDGTLVPSYRGDAVNSPAGEPGARRPDPARLLRAYECAERVLKVVRDSWTGRPPLERACVSHEALLLDYEHPLMRGGYAASAHSVWIGDRTRRPDGPHVAFARSVSNTVGVKIGPSTTPAQAVRLSRLLNPDGRDGRLVFIVRLGGARARSLLPEIVGEVTRRGRPVVWLCDPMHGNTMRMGAGPKTRPMEAILEEIVTFVRVMRVQRRHPAGMHLEMTPEDVTECIAAPRPFWRPPELPRYRTACDPRLNAAQAAEVVERFAALV